MSHSDGSGAGDSFVKRHPVLYAAKIAVGCAMIMLITRVISAWLDGDEMISMYRALRYSGIVFTMFFVVGSGFLLAGKRWGGLR